jgi:hypothetical protein
VFNFKFVIDLLIINFKSTNVGVTTGSCQIYIDSERNC